MDDHKINHSEDKNFPPVAMTFFGKVNSTAFFNGEHSDDKEESAYTIKVEIGKPGLFECWHR